MPETEVVEKAKRRQYICEYKLRILQEVEACKEKGEIGALLAREGLYSSLIYKWREQRDRGSLEGLSAHSVAQKLIPGSRERQAKGENERLRKRLNRPS